MKSKIDYLFGTNTDEVTSENGDIDQSIQTQLNQNDFDLQYCFKGKGKELIKYPQTNSVEF